MRIQLCSLPIVIPSVRFDDRYILGNYNFTDAEDFQSYLDEIRSSIDGNVNPDVEVTQQSSILTLSTCIAEAPDQRWLVNATLMKYSSSMPVAFLTCI